MTETNDTAAALPRDIEIKITLNEKGNPPGKVADAEIHFSMGILAGLKLIGFSVWERRRQFDQHGERLPRELTDYNVTFPARQYQVNGERRSFALLRPVMDISAQAAIRDAIITTYRATVEPAEQPTPTGTRCICGIPGDSDLCPVCGPEMTARAATMPQDARPTPAVQPVIDF